jgi:hypothetical protein
VDHRYFNAISRIVQLYLSAINVHTAFIVLFIVEKRKMIPSSSLSSSSSSSSAYVLVEKATSEFLNGPDWTMNINICDTINSNRWLAKDFVKAVKKRMQHKNPKVQLLSLTLLEMMVKNCGDYVHTQIAEKSILQDMTKTVKKKVDMQVREKILVLLSSWQEAFGGAGGRLPQYYWAYEDLRRSGIVFPSHSPDAAPIFTPPVTHPAVRVAQPSYGMPINSSTRLDEAMASEIENLSLSSMNSMRTALDLLSDMLQAVDPDDREAVKDEIIVDLVDRCRSNQKKLMQMLTTTSDEELLGQGLDLNDIMQSVLAKRDAVASGTPLPIQAAISSPHPINIPDTTPKANPDEARISTPQPTPVSPGPVVAIETRQVEQDEEEEEEDDFAQLARRHSKTMVTTAERPSSTANDNTATSTEDSMSKALVVSDVAMPPPSGNMKEQDMIDFLSLALSGPAASPSNSTHQTFSQTPPAPAAANSPSTVQGYPHTYQVPSNSYVVPWAQAQTQAPPQPPSQPPQQTNYPPPPWASTPGYYSGSNQVQLTNDANIHRQSFPQGNYNASSSYYPSQGVNAYPARGPQNGDSRPTFVASSGPAQASGNKTFVPSYRLFEDLNVIGNGDSRFRTNTTSQPQSSSGQSMVGGRK